LSQLVFLIRLEPVDGFFAVQKVRSDFGQKVRVQFIVFSAFLQDSEVFFYDFAILAKVGEVVADLRDEVSEDGNSYIEQEVPKISMRQTTAISMWLTGTRSPYPTVRMVVHPK
jgi:hypothetical protein